MATEPARADLALWQAAALWRIVWRCLVLVQLGLLIGCLSVPLLGADTDPQRSDSEDEAKLVTLRLLRALPYYLSDTPNAFGDPGSHPYSVPIGRQATVVVLVVLLVCVLLAAAVVLGSLGESVRAPIRVLGVVAGAGLIAAGLLLALVQGWLGNDDFAAPLQPGLLVPVGAGVWLLSLLRARRSWDELAEP